MISIRRSIQLGLCSYFLLATIKRKNGRYDIVCPDKTLIHMTWNKETNNTDTDSSFNTFHAKASDIPLIMHACHLKKRCQVLGASSGSSQFQVQVICAFITDMGTTIQFLIFAQLHNTISNFCTMHAFYFVFVTEYISY